MTDLMLVKVQLQNFSELTHTDLNHDDITIRDER